MTAECEGGKRPDSEGAKQQTVGCLPVELRGEPHPTAVSNFRPSFRRKKERERTLVFIHQAKSGASMIGTLRMCTLTKTSSLELGEIDYV